MYSDSIGSGLIRYEQPQSNDASTPVVLWGWPMKGVEMKTKICLLCGRRKNLDSFYLYQGCKDGHRNQCKKCRDQYVKGWIKDNTEHYKQHCRQYCLDHIEQRKVAKKTWYEEPAHKALVKKKAQIWRQKNPEAYRRSLDKWYKVHAVEEEERHAKWRRDNPEYGRFAAHRYRARRRKAVGEYSLKKFKPVLQALGEHCLHPEKVRCSGPITIDHITALAVGGTNLPDNLQPLCKFHNSSKSTKYADYRTTKQKAQILRIMKED